MNTNQITQSAERKAKIERLRGTLDEIIEDLEAGLINQEDLGKENIEKFLAFCKDKMESTQTMPRVLVTVSGGVACTTTDGDVDISVFDFDNAKADPDGTSPVPARFADLAERAGAPVEGTTSTSNFNPRDMD